MGRFIKLYILVLLSLSSSIVRSQTSAEIQLLLDAVQAEKAEKAREQAELSGQEESIKEILAATKQIEQAQARLQLALEKTDTPMVALASATTTTGPSPTASVVTVAATGAPKSQEEIEAEKKSQDTEAAVNGEVSKTTGSLGTAKLRINRYEEGWFADPFKEGNKPENPSQYRWSDGKKWTKYVNNSSHPLTKEKQFEPVDIDTFDAPKGWRWPKKEAIKENWLVGDWAFDWRVGEIGTRFIYDSDGKNESFDAFDNSRLSVSLDFLTIYGRKRLLPLDVEWGPQVGVGIASADSSSMENAVLTSDYGIFFRPIDKNWQVEWGILHAISGNDSLGFSERNDTGFYMGVSLGGLYDTAKATKE